MTQPIRQVSFNNLHAFGLIVQFLEPSDITPMWKQIDRNYQHGGGWRDFDGFEVGQRGDEFTLTYDGDPPYEERGRITFRDTVTDEEELLVIFDSAWVLWKKGDEHKIARID